MLPVLEIQGLRKLPFSMMRCFGQCRASRLSGITSPKISVSQSVLRSSLLDMLGFNFYGLLGSACLCRAVFSALGLSDLFFLFKNPRVTTLLCLLGFFQNAYPELCRLANGFLLFRRPGAVTVRSVHGDLQFTCLRHRHPLEKVGFVWLRPYDLA